VRRRAGRLAELVARTCDDDEDGAEQERGPIHLVGHSTGGIDVRLVATPDVALPCARGDLAWLPRLASVTTLGTPHHGTPVAAFFTTVSGQRLLYALSALTFIGLTLGSPPLAAASALVLAIARMDRALRLDIRVLDRATDGLLRVLDDARSHEVRAYLDALRSDQAAMVQLMPEAMDLVNASLQDRPGVTYQCTVAMAPSPGPMTWVRSLGTAWGPISTTIFAALWGIASRYDERYPCALPDAGVQGEAALVRAFGRAPDTRANDGVVPTRSQIWGKVAWAGYADHLDVLGHFDGGKDPGNSPHVDWLRSGAAFNRTRFHAMVEALVEGMLGSPP